MSRFVDVVVPEIKEALPATVLFLFLFHMVALTRAVELGEPGLGALRATTATLGALIVAKAILAVEALPISRHFAGRLAAHILRKSALFALVALAFRLLEEVIHLARERGSLSAGVDALADGISWPVFWVTMLWVVGGLLVYCLAAELARIIGHGEVRRRLFGPNAA